MITGFCALGLLMSGCAIGHYLRSRSGRMPPYVMRDGEPYWLDPDRRVTLSLACAVWAALAFGLALVVAVARHWGA